MSHTYIASCTNSSKDDDTLIIIVNSDGTLSVDPETLQKLLANQHHNSPISLVRLDAKGDGSGDTDGAADDDDDPDSRVNLTVEGYYPPTPAPSSPTPPPTPVPDTSVTTDGNPEILADSITEILQPEDVEKLETALQSEHAKEILGDVVLDMLQKNGEESVGGMGDGGSMAQGSVVLDHCYASLTGPTPSTQPPVVSHQPTVVTTPTRGAVRGRGRGRGQAHSKAMQSLVPVVQQLVIPGATVGSVPSANSGAKGQTTVSLQGINLQQVASGVMPCTVMLRKVPVQSNSIILSSLPQETVGVATVKTVTEGDAVPTKKKGVGRGRGGGATVRGGRGGGRGRGGAKLSQQEEAKNKQLAEEMAATVHALTLAEAEQFAQIESMDQSGVEDSDRVIPLVNKVPAKKPVKVYRRTVDTNATTTHKTIKVLKPDKQQSTAQPKPRKKSVSVESSGHDDKTVGEAKREEKMKREEKVIVVSMEPQITPAVVSAVVMSQSPLTTSVSPAAPAPVTTPAAVGSKKYPKRENRKPPAHLAEAFGPALFSTPDIIRRVSDKSAPTTPMTPSTPTAAPAAAPIPPTSNALIASPAADTSSPNTSKLEDELGLTEPEILDTINSQVTKQEDQLLEEALLLEELGTLPTEDILQDDIAAPAIQTLPDPPTPTATTTVKKQKNLSQTSLSAFFPKVNQKDEAVVESTSQVVTPGGRKLPPIELPATRGATKRATQQKEQPPAQDSPVRKAEATKKVAVSVEKRKSTDSRKSVDSKKSAGREDADESLVSDEISDEEGEDNSEDDPNRLWCICRKPHNNRFMICCDFCEDWFHGKCVGITKAMGEQMEEKEIEWMCPNCKKKKKQEEAAAKKQIDVAKIIGVGPNKKSPPVAVVAPSEAVVETPSTPPKEKKPEASKVMVQQQKLVVLGQDTPKSSTKGTEIRITKVSSRKSMDERKSTDERKSVNDTLASQPAVVEHHQPDGASGVECIVCKKESFPGGVYCSDECIAKHASESLSMIDKSSVIVFEKKTGRIFGGANGPTPSTLTSWLMAHPSYEVMRPGVLPTAKYYNQSRTLASTNTPPAKQPRPALKQTVLQSQNRPQGIQLIAALPQPPPVEGPMKKNLQKSEPPPSPVTPKAKLPPVAKGQQQITTLLKVQQPKHEAAEITKASTAKAAVTPPAPKKQPVKEQPKKTTPQAPPKKTTPTVVKKTPKEEDKVKEEVRSKEQEEVNVRASVRKTLQDILTARLQDVDDLKLSEDQVKKITMQIEEELHALFKDTNIKYKAKYRSLMFNIKDKNNLTLFRKIADKSISPEQLVRLSPEELASQELAQWREREARHQLEMIKKTELDLMQQAKTVVMKTHKGEQVVENEDGLGAKVLETSVEIEPVTITASVTPSAEVPVAKTKEDKEVKHNKKEKDKKEDKHKERRHSSHHKEKSHQKDHHKSRGRHRSRHRSESERRSKSRSPVDVNKSKESVEPKQEEVKENERKSRSRHQRHERERSKSRHSERSKSRPRERSKSRPRGRSKSRQRERSKSRPRERSKSRPRERSKSRTRQRSKSRPRERSKSINEERSKSKDRSRSKSQSKSEIRSRSKSRHRERSKTRLRNTSQDSEENKKSPEEEQKDESVSDEKINDVVEIPEVQPAIIDAEVKGIIRELVVEEETGLGEEDLSDREPSSTVNISTPPYNTFEEDEPSKPPVWRGTLIMPDVAKFSTSIQEVSGICEDLTYDLPDTIDCVGRISPETAWDYIAKMKKSGTKQILVVRFSADNGEDKMSYLSFYSYLSSRNRLGVVGNNSKMIKDFYILPLPSHSPVPQVLLPLDGPGFEDYRPHLLLGIIVRTRRKRLVTEQDIPFVPKVAKKSERSYTPPLPDDGGHTPPTTQHQHPVTESFTPPHSPKPPRIIKLKPKRSKALDSPTVSEDFVLEDGDTPYTPEDDEADDADAPYSPGEGEGEERVPSPGCSEELQRKVDKLNRMINDIEERKQKIDSGIISGMAGMSPPQEIIMGAQEEEEEEVEEAYSPSGSITPPPPDSSYLDKGSGKISLPSDLQEIIASLKKKPDEPKSMDLQSDPIVQAYRSADEPYSPEDEKADLEPEVEEKVASPASEESFSTQSSARSAAASVKVNRDPRQRPHLSLNQLSDEEIMKKASEMGFMNPENPEPIPDVLKSRMEPPSIMDEHGPQLMQQPPSMYINQQYSSSQPPFAPEFPSSHPPTHLPPPTFPPPGQFQPPHMYQSAPPPLPPLPPSHIPFTNPQPPPPQAMYPPPPQQPAPLPPPPPKSPESSLSKKKFSKKKKKSKELRNRKEKKEKRKYSESPPPKDYDYDEREKTRDRDRYSSKKRDKRETWRTYDKSPPPEKRRESWDYEPAPPTPRNEPPPPIIPGPPSHSFVPGPMRGGPMRGRFQRGMRGGFRRGFDRGPMRGGFHRGGFHQRGHHMGGPPGPSRNFAPKNIQSEYEEDIRRFEEQRLKQKNLERRRWRNESPPARKRRGKEGESD